MTFWPNHHHRLLSIHLRCITAFTSSVKPQLLFRGQPAAAGSGWKFRRRMLGSHRNQRCLPVSGLPASSQTQTAPGEANSASRRSQMCSGWFWTSTFCAFTVPHPQRVSLGLLNYLRSLERTLTFDLAGLQLEEGELCSTAEETGWMNAARGGGGEAGGLGSLQFSHNTPVDCKVRTEILIGRSVCWKQEHYFLFSIHFTKSH